MAPAHSAKSTGDCALGLALLLPAGLLLWPDVLGATPSPASLAAGWTLLSLLPAACLLLLRAPSEVPRSAWLLALVAIWGTLRALDAGDSFEAQRATMVLWSAVTLLLGGLSLGQSGQRILRSGMVAAGLVALGQAAWLATPGGLLGDQGDLAEAVLPGAMLGIAWFAEARPRGSWLGAGLALACAIHAGSVSYTHLTLPTIYSV